MYLAIPHIPKELRPAPRLRRREQMTCNDSTEEKATPRVRKTLPRP